MVIGMEAVISYRETILLKNIFSASCHVFVLARRVVVVVVVSTTGRSVVHILLYIL